MPTPRTSSPRRRPDPSIPAMHVMRLIVAAVALAVVGAVPAGSATAVSPELAAALPVAATTLSVVATATSPELAVSASPPLSGAAQARTWNALPNGGFENGQVLAMAAVGGDLYVGGYFSGTGDWSLGPLGNVARYDTLTRTWHPLPRAGLSSIVYAMAAVGTDLYVAGGFSHTGDGAVTDLGNIVRFDTIAETWHTMPSGGVTTTPDREDHVFALAVDGNDLYVGGEFSRTGDGSLTDLGGIARYDTQTRTWHALAAEGVNGSVRAMSVSRGVLYAGGTFQATGDGSVTELGNIARFDGAWHALAHHGLSGTTTGIVRALAFVDNGLYVGGGFTQTADGAVTDLNRIARYDTTSDVWRPLPRLGLNDQVFALAIADGALYVGGYPTATGDGTLADLGRIAIYEPSQDVWRAMPNGGLAVGGAGHCRVETLLPRGADLYVGGGFEATGDWSVTGMGGIARYGPPPPDTGSTVYLPFASRD